MDTTRPARHSAGMTPAELKEILTDLGWKQIDLARRLEEAGGAPVDPKTIWRYLHDQRKIPPGVAAYLKLHQRLKRAGITID